MSNQQKLTGEWCVIRDFDSVERDHSRPKVEARLGDGGQTVFIRETGPMSGVKTLSEVSVEVFKEIAARLP